MMEREPRVGDIVKMHHTGYGEHGKILKIDLSNKSGPYEIVLLDGGSTEPKGYIGHWLRQGFELTDIHEDELLEAELKWQEFFNG